MTRSENGELEWRVSNPGSHRGIVRPWRAVAVAAIAIILVACSVGDDDSPVGEIVFTFQRGGNSLLPAEADSALVRVWDRSSGTSKVRAFAIPSDVSASVNIQVSASVGALYQVDAVAFHTTGDGDRVALAAGETQGVRVAAGQSNPLHFGIGPWTAALEAPDTLTSGETATITLTFTDIAPVEDVFASTASLTYAVGPTGTPHQADVTRTGKVATATFVVPDVADDTALYFQYSFDVDPDAFESSGATFTADVPETLAGEALLRRPVRAALGGARTVH